MVRNSLFKNTIILVLLSLLSLISRSQTYQFKNYGENEGLPNRFVYTINQDNNGFIWLGTGKGLCRFDGFEYYMSYVSDTLETIFPVSSYETKAGTIYFGFNDGTVHYTDHGDLIQIQGVDAVRINDIIEREDSTIYIVTQSKGLYRYDPSAPENLTHIDNPTGEFLYCAAFVQGDRIALGNQNGIALCGIEGDRLELIADAEELYYYKVQDIKQSINPVLFYLATEDNGIYIADFSNDSIGLDRISEDEVFNSLRVQSVMADKPGLIWISTFGNGLFKAETDSLTAKVRSFEVLDNNSGLAGDDIKTSYKDYWGNIWIGHFGNGVSVLSSVAYKFHKPGNGKSDNNIIYVSEYGKYVFAGTVSGFYLYDLSKESVVSYTDLSHSLYGAMISDFYLYDDGSMLIGTEGQGVYRRSRQGRTELFFRSGNNLENYISDIIEESGFIWLATRSGVIIIDKQTGGSKRYTTSEKLPHNNINQLVPDGKGDVLVATQSNRLFYLNPEDGVISGKSVIHGGLRIDFQSLGRDYRGRIWGATSTQGIYCFENDSVWNINAGSGLHSNYCYSLLCDSKNNIWIGHQGAFSVYNQEMDIIRTFEGIFTAGAYCNDNAICEISGGYILIGTTEGFMVYDPSKDKAKLYPPKTNIISVMINDERMPLKSVYNLPYSPRYDIRVDFVGLNYSDPEKVYYSYSLENYDTKWSDPTYSRHITYRLSSGNYRFNVLAYSYDGISDNQIKSFVVNIRKPFWGTWLFMSGSAVILVLAVVIIIKIREKAQAKVQRYLENELAERTKEVIRQKEEIEFKNREITDSINYAQRIQASLLPPVMRLNEKFKGAFVFYRPRDIVSGDFYWFDKVSEGKIIIVCADSTGHGVPGAFMSMIGSALLQEIVNRKEITRPSEILRTLDKEINTTLNQTGDDTSNDGMDMVVCEYDPETRLLRFASALRPVVLIMDGEQYYIRGNKNSVGGENLEEKYFDDQEYYLKENDIVYIFSDGYPDQFGGPDGKKLKIVRLRRLIDDIKHLEMEEQYQKLTEFFDEWRGKLEQIDDVLLMAFKV